MGKLKYVALAASLLFTTAFYGLDQSSRLFSAILPSQETVHYFQEAPKVYLAQEAIQGSYRQVKLRRPLRAVHGRAMISFEDLEALVDEGKLVWDEATGVVSIQQLNRLFMAVDRNAYLENGRRMPLSEFPTMIGGDLYLPLRFTLEKMGYSVHYGGANEILVVAPHGQEGRIIAASKFKISSIPREVRFHGELSLVAVEDGIIYGLGTAAPQEEVLFRFQGERVQQSKSVSTREWDYFHREQGKLYFTTEDQMEILDIHRGIISIWDLPQMLMGGRVVYGDRDFAILEKEHSIYRMSLPPGRVEKMGHFPLSDDVAFSGNNLYQSVGGNLIKITGRGSRKVSKKVVSFPTGRGNILWSQGEDMVLYEEDRGVLQLLHTPTDTVIFSQLLSTEGESAVTFQGRYLTVGCGNKVYEFDSLSRESKIFDLSNISGSLEEGEVLWFSQDSEVVGYWRSTASGQDAIRDRIIRFPKN
ncbi:MAG: copper amine oxidase N-terminal domain-containing protein [Tissierellia bacterium]|nr:copper amine oxidase N-terminal domain-containing protein [Tissierellia bacterium]